MISRVMACVAALLTAPFVVAEGDGALVFKVGKVVTMDDSDTVINNAVVVARDGKIETVGRAGEVDIPDGAEVIEMPDCWITPGLVELHNHTGGSGQDLHDYVYLTNPGLRTVDSVHRDPDNFDRAQAGGVTTALLISGSGTNMSGFGTVIKFSNGGIDDIVEKFPASIKIAQAGNPERYWYGVGRSFMNYNLRHTLRKAKEYHESWRDYEQGTTSEPPRIDPTFDDFRGLFDGDFIASVHTQAYQVVMMTLLMVDEEFGAKTVLDHSTFDGYKTAPLVNEAGDVITMNGPRQFYFDRTQRKIFGNAARWAQGEIPKLGVNTDAPVIPQEELSYQAAMACWYGWKPYEALKGVTRVGAEALLMDDQLGRVQPGYDADFGVWSGDPIDPRSTCWITVVDGEIVRDARHDVRRF
ncbi:MAG: amidohydrolase family protein [Phycisphaerales bacterium]